ncbi:phage virion morphogenesis protein [Niabella sp. 22666]|uniref:phage virion morphogenesis protein n=1 Tax=Niabella sp. 22666 TaxID=3453954 RepID=UPI003F84765F
MQNNLWEISRRLQQAKREMPAKVGVLMIAFTKDRFKYQNWMDTGSEKWQRRSRKKPWKTKGRARNNEGRKILYQSGTLARKNRVINTTENSVTIGNDTPYAAIHNNGGLVNVKQRVRRFTRMNPKRDMFGVVRGKEGKKSSKIKYVKTASGISIVKEHTRHMKFRMPRRRFMGPSQVLTKQISRFIQAEINKCFRP